MREFGKRRSLSTFDHENHQLFQINFLNRRQSCHCQQCGKKSDFQIRSQNIQPLPDSLLLDSADILAQQEAKRLEILENRLKTCQDELDKIELVTKKRRRSCYCSDCGQQTQFQIKNQNIPLISCRKIKLPLKGRIQKRAHLLVQNIQTKSQFYYNFKYHSQILQTQLHQSKQTTTARVLKESKLKLIDLEHRVSVTPKLLSPKSEQFSPQNARMSSIEMTPRTIYPNPYLTKRKFLSPPRNFNFKLPPLTNSSKEQTSRKSFFPKRDY